LKILITGGLGFIGSNVAIELFNRGYEIVILDNLSNSTINILENLNSELNCKIPFFNADIRDKKLLRKIFSKNKFLGVLHFAGLKSVPDSLTDPISYYDNNVIGSINLAIVMSEYGCKNIIFSSSATVYGLPESLPIKEDEPVEATNPYGESKLVYEKFLENIGRSDSDWNFAILRYFNPVGSHKSFKFGDSPNGSFANLMPHICRVAAGKEDFLEVFGGDYNTVDGSCLRDYIHVSDLARGHVAALDFILNEKKSINTNLGTGKGYSVIETIKTFERVNKVKVPFMIGKRRAGDVESLYADNSLARKLLNWRHVHSLEDMCKDSWNFQKKYPNGHI